MVNWTIKKHLFDEFNLINKDHINLISSVGKLSPQSGHVKISFTFQMSKVSVIWEFICV